LVELHYEVETTKCYPFITKRSPKFETNNLCHDPRKELAYVSQLEDSFFQNGANIKLLTLQLRNNVKALCTTLRKEMEEEERVIPKQLEEHFKTECDTALWQSLSMFNSIGMSGLQKVVPWVVHGMEEWAGEKFAAQIVSAAPPKIKNLYQNYWKTEYIAKNRIPLESLKKNTPPIEPRERCCWIWRYYELPEQQSATTTKK